MLKCSVGTAAIKGVVGECQVVDIALAKGNGQVCVMAAFLGFLDHRLAEIKASHLARWPDKFCHFERILTEASADIEDLLPWLNIEQGECALLIHLHECPVVLEIQTLDVVPGLGGMIHISELGPGALLLHPCLFRGKIVVFCLLSAPCFIIACFILRLLRYEIRS
jgi:hypothetical protein